MLLKTMKASSTASSFQIHSIFLRSSHIRVLQRVASHRYCRKKSYFSSLKMNHKTEKVLTVEAPYVNLSEPCFKLSWSYGFLCELLSSIPPSCGKLLSSQIVSSVWMRVSKDAFMEHLEPGERHVHRERMQVYVMQTLLFPNAEVSL